MKWRSHTYVQELAHGLYNLWKPRRYGAAVHYTASPTPSVLEETQARFAGESQGESNHLLRVVISPISSVCSSVTGLFCPSMSPIVFFSLPSPLVSLFSLLLSLFAAAQKTNKISQPILSLTPDQPFSSLAWGISYMTHPPTSSHRWGRSPSPPDAAAAENTWGTPPWPLR